MPVNWITIAGRADVLSDGIRYVATKLAEGPSAGQKQVAVVKSNVEFESGEIGFNVLLHDPQDACQIILNHGLQPEIYVGLRAGGYQIALWRNAKWEFVSYVGSPGLPIGRSLAIQVRVRGSQIDLFVDGVKVCSAVQSVQESQIALFL